MDPWLQRESIAEDITAWVLEYRDRAIARAVTPQGQSVITTTLNGLLDELNVKMFLAESQAKDAYEDKHCAPGKCCNDEEPQ